MAALRKSSNTWWNAPSLPNKGLPTLNCSLAEANIFAYSSCVIVLIFMLDKQSDDEFIVLVHDTV